MTYPKGKELIFVFAPWYVFYFDYYLLDVLKSIITVYCKFKEYEFIY